MNAFVKQRYRMLGEKVIEAMKRRGFEAFYVDSADEAREMALDMISKEQVISWGGTTSAEEIGLISALRKGDYKVIDRDTAKSPEERTELMRQSLLSDVYITSANAFSEDGELVYVDGNGNRVAAVTYGPKNVIAVIGMNKYSKSIEDAERRARTFAAPINVQRFAAIASSPCAKTGACVNCKGIACNCNYLLTVRNSKPAGRIKVILVGEELGF